MHASPHAITVVGVVIKPEEPRARELMVRTTHWLLKEGVAVFTTERDACCPSCPFLDEQELADRCDLVVVLGGDGTLIRTASLIRDQQTPILGVNVGTLGFLTETVTDELFGALRNIMDGDYRVTRRSRMRVRLLRGRAVHHEQLALNDMVIYRGPLGKLIKLRLSVNGRQATIYRADGLIVATPTGSTAYNLSAGGPIIHPDLRCLVLTPVAPHSLTDRTLLLPDSARVSIECIDLHDAVMCAIDGAAVLPLEPGDILEVESSPHDAVLVESSTLDYFAILRKKLRWGEG